MPLRTPLCDLLGIRHPVLAAPMANGPSTPELAAAVSRAGGLGVLAASGLSPDDVAAQVRRCRELGAPRVAVNVQLAPPTPATASETEVAEALAPTRRALGLDPAHRPPPGTRHEPAALLGAAVEAGADVLSVALGDPGPVAAIARRAGVPLIAMVTTVAEARRSAEGGADVVMAQGAEAGGHRSTFAFGADDAGPLVGTFALVPLVVDAVDLPVVAAGGVADGRGLAAALALGAQGVALGTRFLLSREAAVAPAYRARLRMLDPADTFVTAAVTGRPARWVRNRVVEELLAAPGTLGWPGQAAAIADVRAAAALAGDEERLPMLAGQAAALASGEEGAEAIVAELVADAEATLRRLAPRP